MTEMTEFRVEGTWLQLMCCALPVVLSLISGVESKVRSLRSWTELDGVGQGSEIMQGRRGFNMIFELLKVTGV